MRALARLSATLRGPASQVQQYLEWIIQLPRAKQRTVIDVIEAMLAQQER